MIGQLHSVVIDCPDPAALARFYAELLGLDVTREESDWVVLASRDGRTRLDFQLAPNLKAPQWPDPDRPQQFHLDVMVADVDIAEQEVLQLGATRLDGQGDDFRVYADPAGHPFCLVWQTEAPAVAEPAV